MSITEVGGSLRKPRACDDLEHTSMFNAQARETGRKQKWRSDGLRQGHDLIVIFFFEVFSEGSRLCGGLKGTTCRQVGEGAEDDLLVSLEQRKRLSDKYKSAETSRRQRPQACANRSSYEKRRTAGKTDGGGRRGRGMMGEEEKRRARRSRQVGGGRWICVRTLRAARAMGQGGKAWDRQPKENGKDPKSARATGG